MEKIRLYILTKNGTRLHPEIVSLLIESARKYGEPDDFGMGSAYNMPVYLLGEIEGHADSTLVVAWDMDGEMPHPRAFLGRNEVQLLMEALEANLDGDSWEIAVELNRRMREGQ